MISFSWHLQPCLKHGFVKVPAAPLAVLECSGSVLTGPKRQWALPETQEDPSECKEALLYCQGDGALAQVAWRGCGVSMCADTQESSGHGPKQSASVVGSA